MDRRAFLAAAGAASLPLAGCAALLDRKRVSNGSFEQGLKHWSKGSDLPTDPNTGEPVSSDVSVGSDRAAVGKKALRCSIDGRQDDGTVWVQQPVDFAGKNVLKLDVYSDGESMNTITKVAVYAGPKRDLTESDFDTDQPVEDHEGWRTYRYPLHTPKEGLLAVGVSVVWETEVTRWLDDVRVA